MGQQLQHDTGQGDRPCSRCGIKYSHSTKFIPCFEEGDTLETWQERHQQLLDMMPPGAINDVLRSEKSGGPPTTKKARKKLVMDTVDDLVIDFLCYDRKDDDELGKGTIDEMVRNGEITADEIVERFRKSLTEDEEDD